ncbi:MAG: glycosyltransferase [Epsilonproteobacteria bacterium]|nr:glycosyltransferase [Campylobacterota bacterium]
MSYPKSTIIISVYKDTEALGLILDSLIDQTYPSDQIIVSEDGDSREMTEYLSTQSKRFTNLLHLSQPDIGWRKNRALNRAIASAIGEYLIFIDGDCIPYPEFIEEHLKLQETNHVLCGRRSEPGKYFSTLLRTGKMSLKQYESTYLWNFLALKRDNVKHYEEGIYLGSHHPLLHLINRFSRKNSHIVGCNFSCHKSDMIRINGFDEDFTLPTTGEDSDIERRMRLIHVQMKSCRNAANMVHLDHPKNFNPEISEQTVAIMHSKGNNSYCKKGLNQYKGDE